MPTRIPIYNGVLVSDQNNTANALVERADDGSINIGTTNTTRINNTGGTSLKVKNFAATGTLDGTATLISVDGTASAYALNLPVASASVNVWYSIVLKNATHTVTITSNGTDNIVSSGTPTATTYALTTIGQHVIVWCDGTQWYVK